MNARKKQYYPARVRWRHRAEYLIFRSAACLIGMLSARQTAALARTMAFVIFRLLPRRLTRYKVAQENIRAAFGKTYNDKQIDVIIHRMWVHLFRMIGEILQLSRKMRRYNCFDLLGFRDREMAVQALASERPVIVLSGHFGNWEMSIAAFGLFGFPMSVVARPLDNPYLDDWFGEFRRHTGHSMIAKRGAYNRMAAVLKRGGNVALLADQDAGLKGVFVDFFGKPASTFPTIARLAIEHDAYICVGYAFRVADRFDDYRWSRFEMGSTGVVDPRNFTGPNRVRDISQAFTNAVETAVRRAPEQYFWVHRRWKTKPEQAIGFEELQTRKAG